MRTLKGLVIGVALLCVFWTIPAHATVDWDEGFEYADDTAFGNVWTHSCLGNPGISTIRPYSGVKSARLVFRGTVGIHPGAGGCYMERFLPAPSETEYTRFWIYFDHFTLNNVGTKITLQGGPNFYPSFWWIMNAVTNPVVDQPGVLDVHVQGIILDNGQQDTLLLHGSVGLPQNQWVCVEMRTTMSSPGVNNGIIQQWVNGVPSMNFSNVRMRAAALNQQNSPTAKSSINRLYTQHGFGTIYYDDYAVSRDARIGCNASPSGDRQAPGAPSNFSFR